MLRGILYISFVATLFLCYSVALQISPQDERSFPVWVISSLDRVGPNEPAGSGLAAELFAARGEFESFQIVVRAPSGGLSNVNVTVSDLQGPGGERIPNTAFTLYREHYVRIAESSPNWGGSNRPRGAGWYPDGLIPFVDPATGSPLSGATLDAVPFDLPAGANQPVWVDILVPRSAIAGQYVGSFTVSSDQGIVTGQVALFVWHFTLPLRLSLQSSFLVWAAGHKAVYQELLRHRLQPLRTDPALQRDLINDYALVGVGLPFWSGADIHSCTMSPAPSVSQFLSFANAQEPGLMTYVYSADEIDRCSNLYETLKQWARNMHQAGVQNLVTMSPRPELYDDGSGTGRSAVDIWVLLPIMYERSRGRVAEVLRKGDQVWSYNSLVQDSYSPKWLIDFDPINFRIQPGFIHQSLGLTGLLYWRVDLWSSDPWNKVNPWGSGNYPGEGMLLYPGAPVGITGAAPSMRLKWLRDGVEDYEYVEILKQLGKGDWALQVVRTVGADWNNWSHDRQALESARRKLGKEIHCLSQEETTSCLSQN